VAWNLKQLVGKGLQVVADRCGHKGSAKRSIIVVCEVLQLADAMDYSNVTCDWRLDTPRSSTRSVMPYDLTAPLKDKRAHRYKFFMTLSVA